MKQTNMTYAQAEGCYYEAIRINKGGSSEWSELKEGNALIDTTRTPYNVELMQHHSALNPSDYGKHNRGQGIANYHKDTTGRAARMKGDEKQLSKAVGCIITLPKDYLKHNINLTEEEYQALEQHIESDSPNAPKSEAYHSAIRKLSSKDFSSTERETINKFFRSALGAWQKNAGIRDEDMLYAVVHFDESFPHLHIMALPTVKKDNGKITFSTEKFNNHKTHYFDNLHTNIINLMLEDGIDARGLLNGVTKDKGFTPAEFSHQQREEGVTLSLVNRALETRQETLESDISKSEETLGKLQGDILTEKQNKKLAQNKGIKSLVQGGTVNIEVTYELAQSIKKSELTQKALSKRENELDKLECELYERTQGFNREVNVKVEERLPETIKHFQDIVIPQVQEQQRLLEYNTEQFRIKAQAQERREKKLLTQELALKKKQAELENKEHHLDSYIDKEVKKHISKIIKEKMDNILDTLKNFVYKLFKGIHQERLYSAISKLHLPDNFVVDGKNYGGKTIENAMKKAETRDIKDFLHQKGISYSDIDSSDIDAIHKAFEEGKNLDEVIKKIAYKIDDLSRL